MTIPYGLMADLHLHQWASFSNTLETGVNNRLDMLLNEIRRCAYEVGKLGGRNIVMAGDIFHVRGSVAPSVLNPTRDMLERIHKECGTHFIIIPGNHDLEGKHATRIGSAVTALESPWVEVVNEPMWHGGLMAHLVPWFDSIDDLKAELERLPTDIDRRSDYDAIIHAPIDGVITGLPTHGLTPEYLGKLGYGRVFGGHYHNHKTFEGGAISIGALAHHTWSDVGTKAGFLIVTPGTSLNTWFKSHLPEFIDLSKINPDDEDDIALLVDGNYVRVRVEAAKSKEVEAARAELLEMGAKAVLVQAEPKPPADEVRATHSVTAGASLEVSVSEFIGGMKSSIPLEDITREAMSVLSSVDVV